MIMRRKNLNDWLGDNYPHLGNDYSKIVTTVSKENRRIIISKYEQYCKGFR